MASKRLRSHGNHLENLDTVTTPNSNQAGNKSSSFFSISKLSSRVFSGQLFSDACGSLKTLSPPSNPSKHLIASNTPPGLPHPKKILKRSDTNNGVGLGIVASISNELISKAKLICDNDSKTVKNIVQRPLVCTGSEDTIFRISPTKGQSHLVMPNNKSVFARPNDPPYGHVDNVPYIQEKKEKGIMIFPPYIDCPKNLALYPSSSFLSYCHYCGKKLDQKKDIYIYRGDKAYCTEECREVGINLDNIKSKKTKASTRGKSVKKSSVSRSANNEKLFTIGTGIC